MILFWKKKTEYVLFQKDIKIMILKKHIIVIFLKIIIFPWYVFYFFIKKHIMILFLWFNKQNTFYLKKNMMIMFFVKSMKNTIWLFCEKHKFDDF